MIWEIPHWYQRNINEINLQHKIFLDWPDWFDLDWLPISFLIDSTDWILIGLIDSQYFSWLGFDWLDLNWLDWLCTFIINDVSLITCINIADKYSLFKNQHKVNTYIWAAFVCPGAKIEKVTLKIYKWTWNSLSVDRNWLPSHYPIN